MLDFSDAGWPKTIRELVGESTWGRIRLQLMTLYDSEPHEVTIADAARSFWMRNARGASLPPPPAPPLKQRAKEEIEREEMEERRHARQWRIEQKYCSNHFDYCGHSAGDQASWWTEDAHLLLPPLDQICQEGREALGL